MGVLYYGNNSYAVEMDDRPLAHLKCAMLSLLRAGTSMAFSFDRPVSIGSGRETLWISPTTEIRFRFHGSRPPQINEEWAQAIIATADTSAGLHMVPEKADPARPLTSRSRQEKLQAMA